MLNIKNFTRTEPRTQEQIRLCHKHNVMFLMSEDGADWYDCQKNFNPSSIKFAYDSQGIIRSIATDKDVSTLWPIELSVAEVLDTIENRRADISGNWGFDGDKIIWLMTPAKALEQKNSEIDSWRSKQADSRLTFEWNGHLWDASKASQEKLAPVLVVANSGQLPEGFFWTDASNNDVPMTVEELRKINIGMTQAMVEQDFKIHERQRQMKKEIQALTITSEILNYPVGWLDNPV
ncbi:DUF4376 domain-containing protein [Yokenella regensburgei]|uniref:DUF4376 domain-containing protein n=1 Tax=Yokenella regensburgei TaxID=158877 RepID=UPI003EDAB344